MAHAVRKSRLRVTAAWLGIALCVACEPMVPLQTSLTAEEAARSVTALHSHHISARQELHPGSRADNTTFDLWVLPSEAATACRALSTRQRATQPASRVSASFVPTPAEETARSLDQTRDELERAIGLWPNVIDVRVQLVLEKAPAVLGTAAGVTRASIVVTHPYDKVPAAGAIHRHVEHTLGTNGKNATLVSLVAASASAPEALVQVGPIAVTPGSAPLLRGLLGGLFATTSLLAGMLLWSVRKRQRARR